MQANVDLYDAVTDTWSSLSPMTVARGGLSLGIVLTPAPVIYAVGGFHCTNGTRTPDAAFAPFDKPPSTVPLQYAAPRTMV